jgi:LuxR family maltose regulon positive regulatory protein
MIVPTDPWAIVPQRVRHPQVRADALDRSRLLDRLSSSGAPVVAVVAGGGYGKTTLLRQWTTEDPRRSAWVSLDPADDDSLVLARHLARSLAGAGVTVEATADALSQSGPRALDDGLNALARELSAVEDPFILVVDDVHAVSAPSSLELLDRLAPLIPDGSTLALAGRSLSGLHLARLHLEDAILEFHQEDLAFTAGEADALLRGAAPSLDGSSKAALIDRSEGWPAVLYLGVLALREHPDPPVLVKGLLGSDHRVIDYLHQEVLDRLDPDLHEFLVQVSVLDLLTAPVCDALLDRTDSASVLDRLAVAGNLFVAGTDAPPSSFRLHPLFADMLLRELRARRGDAERRLRATAALWFDAAGESDAAVRQAVASGDETLAADVLYRQIAPTFRRGEAESLDRWLALVPTNRVPADGLLALTAAWAALVNARPSEVRAYHDLALERPRSGRMPDGSADFDVAVAALRTMAGMGGVLETADSALKIKEAGPDGSPWWSLAATVAATCRAIAGAPDAMEVLALAEVETRGDPAPHVVALCQLAIAHLRSGERRAADLAVRDALEELHAHHLESYSMTAMVHVADAWASATRGDEARARRAIAIAVHVVDGLGDQIPRATAQAGLGLAEAELALQDPDRAAHLARQASERLVREPDAVALHTWAAELAGRIERHRGHPHAVTLTSAEQRVLEQLPTHRSLEQIGEALYISRNTVKTHTLSIYRKLEVSSRNDAVERARTLGLLP